MKFFASFLGLSLAFAVIASAEDVSGPKPLKALLIAGGCCHDYAAQQKALSEGIQARANVRVDVVWTDDSGTNPPLPVFDKPDWVEGYDVIIHDHCAADNKDVAVVERILAAHQSVPAVHLHCAMHSFRNGTDLWFKHLGLASRGHGPQQPIEIDFVAADHPISQGLENWTTGNEELYNNTAVYGAKPIARGRQTISRDSKQVQEEAVIAWINESQGAKSFSTTLGHNTKTVADPRYLDLVTRGLLWSCGKLNEEYLKPYEGENTVTLVGKNASQ